MRIVAPIPQYGGPRIPKKTIFLKSGKNDPKRKNSKRLEICQNQRYAFRPEVSNPSGSVVSTIFCKAKSAKKKKTFFLRGNFRPFPNKNVQMLDHFFPLLFPKDSESLKIFDVRTREVGAKRPLNGTSKVNRRTDVQTDRRTDGQIDLQKASAQRADAFKRPGARAYRETFYLLVLVFGLGYNFLGKD